MSRLSIKRQRRINEQMRKLGLAVTMARAYEERVDIESVLIAEEALSLAMKHIMCAEIASNREDRSKSGQHWKKARTALRIGIDAMSCAVQPLIEELGSCQRN